MQWGEVTMITYWARWSADWSTTTATLVGCALLCDGSITGILRQVLILWRAMRLH